MTSVPTRIAWALAVLNGLVAGATALLDGSPWWLAGLAALAYAGAIRLLTRQPLAGVVALAVVAVVLALLGLSPEQSTSGLLPAVTGPALVGYLLPWRLGVVAVPLLLGSVLVGAEPSPGTVLFAVVLMTIPWWFGTRVRIRDLGRQRAVEEADRLTLVDPAARAQLVAGAERHAQAGAALSVIGNGVAAMTSAAREAAASLEPAAVERLRRTGSETMTRLKELLLLLREPAPDPSEPTAPAPTRPPRAWRHAVLSALPVLLVLLVWLTIQSLNLDDYVAFGVPGIAVVTVVLVAVALRNRWPAATPVVAAGAIGVGGLVGGFDPPHDVQWSAIAALALGWAAGRARTRAAALGLLVLLGVQVVLTLRHDGAMDNVPMEVIIHVLPFLAGTAWAGALAEETVHRARARQRLIEIEVAEEQALIEARLALARDLHDVSSHAVGTMMMQASAAMVLHRSDPVGMRSALETIAAVGEQTLAELGSVSRWGMPRAPASLATGLAGVGSRAADEGVNVEFVSVPDDLAPEDVDLVLRVVREGVANAARHAPGSAVRVDVRTDGEVSVRVSDAGAPGAQPPTGTGHGLQGLRELVEERGGELAAGPQTLGWVLAARFPAYRSVIDPAIEEATA